ncbi:MAG: transglycosylase domain-containing protein [Clostridia bacterium]
MKFFRKLIVLLLIAILLVGGVCYFNGKKLYDEKTSEISLSDKVAEIKNSDSFVSLNSLPIYYKNAVIAVEDHRFYKHGAIDPIAIARAIYSNIKSLKFREGGSTITQQTAKNLYFISEDDVVSRKVAEILLGMDLEKNYSKNDILELYINTIYFGDGYYGIKQACNGYLNKEPQDMTISDATMLAGIPNAPSIYAPTQNPDLTISRQQKVISSMVKYNYLTQDEADGIVLYKKK